MEDFDTNLYETPPEFYLRCHQEFHFQIDAAAEPHTAKCAKFITREQNVLNMTFRNKRIWLNPPYRDYEYPLLMWAEWCSRMTHKYGNTIAFLVPSSTSTIWWHDVAKPEAAEIRAIKGRLHYLANGVPKTGTKHDNVLVIWRPGIRGAQLTSMEATIKVKSKEPA